MYSTSGATIRGDLNLLVEEAANTESWLIGQKVLPMLGVPVKSGIYPKVQIAAAELLRPEDTVRDAGGQYGETTRIWTTDTYDCIDRGLEEACDDTVAKDMGRFFPVEAAKARWVMKQMLLSYEARVQALIQNNTTFPGTNSAVAYTTGNIATISFVADVLAAIERVNDKGNEANTIVMSSTVLNRIKLGTLVQNFVRGAIPGDATLNINAGTLAAAFADNGIKQVLVGRARYNSAKRGQTFSAANVWNNTYIWVGNVQSGQPDAGGAGRSFVWNEEGGLFVTETYRDEKRRSNMIRVRQNTAEKIIDSTAGTMITTQYS
jgi:hypothetical protein